MIAVIKLQYRYLLSKISIWFIILIVFLLTVGILFASGFHSNSGLMDINRTVMNLSFQTESLLILKFALILVTVFMVIQGYYSQFSKYHLFFLQKPKGKIQLGLAKMISVIMMQSLIGFYGMSVIHLTGLYLTPFFEISFPYILAICYVILEMMILGLIGSILIQLIDSIFSGLLPLILYWFVEMNVDYERIYQSEPLQLLYSVLSNPILFQSEWVIVYSLSHYLILGCFLAVFNIAIFMFRDIKA